MSFMHFSITNQLLGHHKYVHKLLKKALLVGTAKHQYTED